MALLDENSAVEVESPPPPEATFQFSAIYAKKMNVDGHDDDEKEGVKNLGIAITFEAALLGRSLFPRVRSDQPFLRFTLFEPVKYFRGI